MAELITLKALQRLHTSVEGKILAQLQPGEGEQLVIDHGVAQGDLLSSEQGGVTALGGYLYPNKGVQPPLSGQQAQQGKEQQKHHHQGIARQIEQQGTPHLTQNDPLGGQQPGTARRPVPWIPGGRIPPTAWDPVEAARQG